MLYIYIELGAIYHILNHSVNYVHPELYLINTHTNEALWDSHKRRIMKNNYNRVTRDFVEQCLVRWIYFKANNCFEVFIEDINSYLANQ